MPRIHGIGPQAHAARMALPPTGVTTKSVLALGLLVVAKLSSAEAASSAFVLRPPVCPALPHSATACSAMPPMPFFKFSQFEIDEYLTYPGSRLDWSRISPHEKAAIEVKGTTQTDKKQRVELWDNAFEDYAQQLTAVVHPLESAVLHHQMRRALEKKHDLLGYSTEADKLMQELCFNEVDSCIAVSEVSEPTQRIQWLQRGIMALVKPKRVVNTESVHSTRFYEKSIALWEGLGETFLQTSLVPDLISNVHDEVYKGLKVESVLKESTPTILPEFIAARCFSIAGDNALERALNLLSAKSEENSRRWQNGFQKTIALFNRTIKILDKIDLSHPRFTPLQRAFIQEEIALNCLNRQYAQRLLGLYTKHSDLPTEAVNVKAIYESQMKLAEAWRANALAEKNNDHHQIYFWIKEAIALKCAAENAPTLELKSELIGKARDTAQTAWDKDRKYCQTLNEFSGEKAANLLDDLKEQALKTRKAHVDSVMRIKTAQSNSSWIPGFLRPLFRIITGR